MFFKPRIRTRFFQGRVRDFLRSHRIQIRFFLGAQIRVRLFSRRSDPGPGKTHPDPQTILTFVTFFVQSFSMIINEYTHFCFYLLFSALYKCMV